MVRTVAVEYAMRQLRHKGGRSPAALAEIETTWRDSLQAASLCHVLAKHFTSLNADEALLTGLLHGLGRLYVVMRAEDRTDVSAEDISEIANSWQATIGKAILQSWGLPEPMLHAVEHQDDSRCERDGKFEIAARATGPASLTDLLVAAKILASGKEPEEIYALSGIRWLSALTEQNPARVLETHGDEIQVLRSSLGGVH